MKVEERRSVYITLTKEEREMLDKTSALIEDIYKNMKEEDELAFIDEHCIFDMLNYYEVRHIATLLSDMQEYTLEIT